MFNQKRCLKKKTCQGVMMSTNEMKMCNRLHWLFSFFCTAHNFYFEHLGRLVFRALSFFLSINLFTAYINRRSMIIKKVFVFFIVFFIAIGQMPLLNQIHSQPATDGHSVPILRAGNILSQPFGTRSIGMGSAQTGRANDLSAMSFNPAGLSLMGYWEWALLHQDYQNDVDGNFILLGAPLPYGNLGFQTGFYTVRNNDYVENGLHSHPDRNKYAYQVGIAYGAPVFKKYLHAGIQIKYFGSNFSSGAGAGINYPVKQSGLFINMGFLGTYDLAALRGIFHYFPQVSAGISIRNMQPQFKISHEANDHDYPELNLGFSMYYSHRFMLNFDVINRRGIPGIFRTGVEFWPFHFLALRTGVGFGGSTSNYRSIHWGVGIGSSVGRSKLIVEYSGFEERQLGWEASRQTYHSFSVNQSFDKVVQYKTSSGRDMRLAIAKSDRYNSAYKYSSQMDIRHLINDVIANLRSFRGYDGQTASVRPSDSVLSNVSGDQYYRRMVALFPFPIEFISGEPENVRYAEDIRIAMINYMNSSPTLQSLPNSAIKNDQPILGRQNEIDYLEGLCNQNGVEMVVMGKVLVDERNDKLTLKLMYYGKGHKKVYYSDREGFLNSLPDFYSEVVQEFKIQSGSLLKLEAL